MRRDLLAATQDLENVRKRMQELERDAADRERELLRLKADRMLLAYLTNRHHKDTANTYRPFSTVEAIGQEQTAALAALKSSDELISESLRTELEATRKQLAQKVLELDAMKEQLMGALLSKDKIQRKLDDVVATTSPGAGAGATSPSQEETQAGAAKGRKEDAEKIEKLKAALRQKIEVSWGFSMQLGLSGVGIANSRLPYSNWRSRSRRNTTSSDGLSSPKVEVLSPPTRYVLSCRSVEHVDLGVIC